MATKQEYLQKYLEGTATKNRKKKRIKKRPNLTVHDDDVDWRALTSDVRDSGDVEDNDPDDVPLVAEFKDDSVRKWLPVSDPQAVKLGDESDDGRGSGDGREAKRRLDSPDLSPPRMHGRSSESEDIDNLPRRRRSWSSDLSPPRRCEESDPEAKRDISPPRRKPAAGLGKRRRPWSPDILSDKDSSHPVKQRKGRDNSLRVVSTNVASRESAPSLEIESTSTREPREPHNIETRSEVPSKYKYAETIYRDKEGRKIDPKSEMIQKEKLMREENAKFELWGRGVAQAKSVQQKIEDDLYEMSKPLARYADDEDLERMLKEKEREGDPMLAFIKRKAEKTCVQTGKPRKAKPAYKGSAPPNRYMIRPGYRWDGVDRSNGFEKAWFSNQSNKKAFNEEAYKWSVEDM